MSNNCLITETLFSKIEDFTNDCSFFLIHDQSFIYGVITQAYSAVKFTLFRTLGHPHFYSAHNGVTLHFRNGANHLKDHFSHWCVSVK